MRREPAAYSIVLQIGIDALGKVLVFGRVANEALKILDRLVQERRQVVDQLVWQAYTAKERDRQLARFLKRSIINDTWPPVNAQFQSDGTAEVNISENG